MRRGVRIGDNSCGDLDDCGELNISEESEILRFRSSSGRGKNLSMMVQWARVRNMFEKVISSNYT